MTFRRLQSTAHFVRPEQHRVERRFGTSAPPENAPKVWIVGDSYVRRGGEEASHTMGNNLGVNCSVQWFGKGGMRWGEFLPFFYRCLQGRTAPDVLVIHCGGNDLGQVKTTPLINDMKRDLRDLHYQFPRMKLILSSINQRRSWRYAPPVRVERDRRMINREMANFVGCVKGTIIYHQEIVFYRPELFLRDRVHLSPRGNHLFLTNIAHCLRENIPMTRSYW